VREVLPGGNLRPPFHVLAKEVVKAAIRTGVARREKAEPEE